MSRDAAYKHPYNHGMKPLRKPRYETLDQFKRDEPVVKTVKPEPQPEPVYKDVAPKAWYQTERNGTVTKVWLEEVKRNKVVLKRDPNAADSYTESRAKFDRFYTPAE